MTKNHAFFAIFIVLLVTTGSVSAQAAGSAGCELSQSEFDELSAVQNDPKLGFLEELRAELRIRKSLLSKTVGCAIQRATELQAELKATPVGDVKMKNAQTQVVSRIDGAITYYGLEKDKISDLGLEGSKKFAANLEAWRAGNYAPVARMASNIMLWAGDQSLIATATSRMNQMGRTIGFLNLVSNNDLQDLWNDTRRDFKATLDLNQGARDALTGAGDANQALDLIKSSLDALSKTYQKLFELSNTLTNAPEK